CPSLDRRAHRRRAAAHPRRTTPRGVVRRYGGPPSALADRPTTAIATSPITSETRFFDMPETVLDGPVRVCPQFVRSRRTFVRKPSHICAHRRQASCTIQVAIS